MWYVRESYLRIGRPKTVILARTILSVKTTRHGIMFTLTSDNTTEKVDPLASQVLRALFALQPQLNQSTRCLLVTECCNTASEAGKRLSGKPDRSARNARPVIKLQARHLKQWRATFLMRRASAAWRNGEATLLFGPWNPTFAQDLLCIADLLYWRWYHRFFYWASIRVIAARFSWVNTIRTVEIDFRGSDAITLTPVVKLHQQGWGGENFSWVSECGCNLQFLDKTYFLGSQALVVWFMVYCNVYKLSVVPVKHPLISDH